MRIIICDDNPFDLEKFSDMIEIAAKSIGEPLELVRCKSYNQVLFKIEDGEKPCAVFWDISLGDADGMEASKQISTQDYHCDTVFLTNSTERWREAFQLHAFDYLIKSETTQSKMDILISEIAENHRHKNREFISVTSGGETHNIPISDIFYFEVVSRIIAVHTAEGLINFYSTMGKIENMLANKGFVRIHRAYLISKQHIESYGFDHVIMTGGDNLPISRGNYAILCKALGVPAKK